MKVTLSEEGILEKVRIEKFRDTLTAGKILSNNTWDAYCMIVRGIMNSLSDGFKQDQRTSLDVIMIVRATHVEIRGYVAINTSVNREVIEFTWEIK